MPSLLEKASRLVFPRLGSNMNPPVRDIDDLDRFTEVLKSYPFGGLVLFNGRLDHTPEMLVELQRQSPTPMLVAADIERGAGQQIEGATSFPHAMAVAAAGQEAVASMARITAIEARSIGIHIAFAPVADVNSDPENPIIGIRAFGTREDEVSACVSTYIRACRDEGLFTTAKHFPGHGNTATDSHAHLPEVNRSRLELEKIDLPPFSAAIREGVDLIMTAHVAYPALDPVLRPATLSAPILDRLLRDELHFRGPVITDSLIMGGVQTESSDLKSFAANLLNAGVDILLDPLDPPAMVEALVHAVEADMVTEQRIDLAIDRIEALLRRTRPILSFSGEETLTGGPAHKQIVLEIAERAVRSHWPADLPLIDPDDSRAGRPLCIFIKPYKTHLDPPEEPLGSLMKDAFPSMRFSEVYDSTEDSVLDELLENASRASRVFAAVVSKPTAWRSYGLPERLGAFLTRLIHATPMMLVALGDPRLLDIYQGATASLCTYSDAPASQEAFVRLLEKTHAKS